MKGHQLKNNGKQRKRNKKINRKCMDRVEILVSKASVLAKSSILLQWLAKASTSAIWSGVMLLKPCGCQLSTILSRS